VAGYTDMRRQGALAGGRKVITATPRQLESLIRLAEAHARLHLRAEVFAEDVEEAIRLVNVATQRAATDPATGTIDLDMIHTGKTAVARNAVGLLKSAVQGWLTTQAIESGRKVRKWLRDARCQGFAPMSPRALSGL